MKPISKVSGFLSLTESMSARDQRQVAVTATISDDALIPLYSSTLF